MKNLLNKTQAVVKNLDHKPPNGVRTTILRWKVTEEENKVLEDLYKRIPHGAGNNTYLVALRIGAAEIIKQLQAAESTQQAPIPQDTATTQNTRGGQHKPRPMSKTASSIMGHIGSEPDK